MKSRYRNGIIISLLFGTVCLISLFRAGFPDRSASISPQKEKRQRVEQSGAGKQLNTWFLAKAYPEPDYLGAKYQAAWQTYLSSRAKNEELTRQGRTSSASWTYLGPFNTIGGRVLCLAIDPANSNNLWIGTASGGIWRSTDAGANWTFVNIPNLPVLGVSSIIIHPSNSNIIYAGTGEVYRNGNSNIGFNVWKARGTYGIGILKSTDGGTTWSQIYTKNTADLFAIQMMAFNPQNPQTVFAAATDGLYRSRDDGATWTRILDKTYVADVEILSTDSTRITVSVGNLVDADKGVYYTTNGGTSWTAGTGIAAFNGFIRLSKGTGTNLYAGVGHGSGNELYSSSNFGQTWTVNTNSTHCGGQYWFSHDLSVNPFDTDSIIMAGVSGFRYRISTAGKSAAIPTVHSDMHHIVFDPVYRGRVYIASDGGIYRSTDGGVSWADRNNGLGATQFYASLAVSPNNANLYLGGLQDNGVSRYNNGTWTHNVVGGDGGPSAWSSNGTTVLTSNDARSVRQSTNSGTSFTQRLDNLGITYSADERTGFMAPVAISKSNNSYMYVGSDNLHISTNGGTSFTRNTPASMTRPIEMTNKTAIALAISPTNHNKVYVSTSPFAQLSNNSLSYNPPPNVLKSINASDDANYTFSSIKTGLPDRFVMDFAISATNDDSVFVVLGGWEDAGGSHIFVTGNGGTSWTDIGTSSILPDVPFNAIAIDPVNPQVIYAACDFGVYVSPDRGTTWLDYNNGFTGTNLIMDLQFTSDNRLIAATHGRGLVISPRYAGTLPVFFSSFTGINIGTYNKIEWKTSQEYDLRRFELERSTDGRTFSYVAQFTPGNNRGSYTYNYNDQSLTASKVHYYRVKAIDLDGTVKYSPVLALQGGKQEGIRVLQNPFSSYISIQVNRQSASSWTLKLLDIQGRELRRKTVQTSAGMNTMILDGVYHLPSGAYVLHMESGTEKFQQKLMKK